MANRRISITLDERVAQKAIDVAKRNEVTLSTWMNAAVRRALVVEAGVERMREWEAEHGEFTPEELKWADSVLGKFSDRDVA